MNLYSEKSATLVNMVNEEGIYKRTSMPPLGLAYLAAATPNDWELTVVDELVQKVDLNEHIEGRAVVGISANNVCNIPRARSFARHIKKNYPDIKIGLGGYPAKLQTPGLEMFDAKIIGQGEAGWRAFLDDVEQGTVRPIYVSESIPLDRLPSPDFSGFDLRQYSASLNWPVMTDANCWMDCSYCAGREAYGDRYLIGNPLTALERIREAPPGAKIYFTAPNLVNPSPAGLRRAKLLFEGVRENPVPWFGSVSFDIHKQEDLMRLMNHSGCYMVLNGFDSSELGTLKVISELKANIPPGMTVFEYYKEGVQKMQEEFDINVVGTFVLGFDTDTEETFEQTQRLVQESGMKDAIFMPLTPLPGTRDHDIMSRQGRIINHNLADYDFTHVVYRPKHFSPEELESRIALLKAETIQKPSQQVVGA